MSNGYEELKISRDYWKKRCEDTMGDVSTLSEELVAKGEEVEALKGTVRLAFCWAREKETWQQTRDVLKNQMFEMGEL